MATATFTPYTVGAAATVLATLGSHARGLEPAEVAERLARFGPNAVRGRGVRPWSILGRQFRSAFVYLLLGAAVVAGALGERTDAGFILAFVLLNAGLGFYQEFHSERTLQLLARYTVPRSKVRRSGGVQTVDSTHLVPGDLVLLEPGDLVPADLRLTAAYDCTVNESVLTGESVPVGKAAGALPRPAADLYAATNIAFAGTTLASGTATGVVVATGTATVLGGIARAATGERPTQFARELDRFSRFTLRIIGATLVLVFVANWLIKGSSDLVSLALFSIALAVSVIPEALPVVITFSLSRGALALARRHVVVKRLPAVEELGAIEVLCTDKTGTLTENRLSVVAVRAAVEADALRFAALAGAHYSDRAQLTNPFDTAIWDRLPAVVRPQLRGYRRVQELPFDPERKRNSVLVEAAEGAWLVVRGAPEVVLPRCRVVEAVERRRLTGWIAEQGTRGNRILAVAQRTVRRGGSGTLTAQERGLTLVGLLAFADPIKPSTVPAVRQAEALGIRIKILTGDAPEVAGAVAYAIGIAPSPRAVITGAELTALPVPEQHAAVERYAAFARVTPEQKTAILQLLQERRTVGFLGEGINDAPALKAADVALVVQGAADVARETADIVLLKPSLSVIVAGIREGRRVFANTATYITATLTSNFGNFYAVAFASLLIPFLPLLPIQILALNLLSDFPMVALATDRVAPGELARPRRYDLKGMLLFATTLGLVSTAFDILMFATFVRGGETALQTLWFVGSVLTELALLFSIRSRRFLLRAPRPSAAVLGLSLAAAGITVALPLTAYGRSLLHFLQPTLPQLGLLAGFVAAYLVSTEVAKLAFYRFVGSGREAGQARLHPATLPKR